MAINSTVTIRGSLSSNAVTNAVTSKSFRSYGLQFPVGENKNGGYFSKISDVNLVRKNLRQLLETERGERFMLPDYGTNLKKYLFEPKDPILFNQIKREIAETVDKYAADVRLLNIQVKATNKSIAGGLEIKLFCSMNTDRSTPFEVNLEVF